MSSLHTCEKHFMIAVSKLNGTKNYCEKNNRLSLRMVTGLTSIHTIVLVLQIDQLQQEIQIHQFELAVRHRFWQL